MASAPGRATTARIIARRLVRLGVVGAVAGIAALGPAGAAGAHVTITPSTTAAGAPATLVVATAHGCAGSPTTAIQVQIPEEIHAVTPTRHALWEVEKQMETLDPPVTDVHGNQVVERVASVTYSATTPLPEGYRDALELSVTLPDAPGTALVFPTIQTCREGESAWIETPQDGQSAEDLELPAPAFTLTAAEVAGHRAGAVPTQPASPSDVASEARRPEGSGGTSPLAVTGLVVGLVGVVLGAAALLLQRRRT